MTTFVATPSSAFAPCTERNPWPPPVCCHAAAAAFASKACPADSGTARHAESTKTAAPFIVLKRGREA